MGMIELGVTFSFTQLMVDEFIIGNIKNMLNINKGMGQASAYPQSKSIGGIGVSSKFDAQQKVLSILYNHKPDPLPPSVRASIREIIVEADRKELTKLGVLNCYRSKI